LLVEDLSQIIPSHDLGNPLVLQTPGPSKRLGPCEMGTLQTTGTVFDIARYSTHDGPGIRTTVFFKGCPLDCWWCHNPEGQSPQPQLVYRADRCIRCLSCFKVCPNQAIALTDGNLVTLSDKCQLSGDCVRACKSGAREIAGKRITVVDLMEQIEKDTVFYDESGGGVTFSGGEPLMQPIFLQTLLRVCKERKIHTALETCGFVDSGTLLTTCPYVDVYLYDLKVVDNEKHQRFTSAPNKVILENLDQLSRSHDRIIIRFPLIPGVNDDEDVSQVGEFVSSLGSVKEVDILPYHKLGIEKYTRLGMRYRMAGIEPLPSEEVGKIADRLRSYGLKVKVGG